MQTGWQKRESKRQWALRNPDKVRRANKHYREWNRTKLTRQAAARMRRYRNRLRVTRDLDSKQLSYARKVDGAVAENSSRNAPRSPL